MKMKTSCGRVTDIEDSTNTEASQHRRQETLPQRHSLETWIWDDLSDSPVVLLVALPNRVLCLGRTPLHPGIADSVAEQVP